ncbi:MAG TPA: TIGR03557 family F420-dependent LLM class oxidoreductase [Actinomycetaceae bacterium]|nr:TIGR03557 family F420-dependent LLM class oxidoreductase [Actinomycetaceae bacterium]
MTTIGYAAALEQLHPSEAVEVAAIAEEQGFTGVMATDHFQPWTPTQGQSAFVWNVLAALGERTRGTMGPGVTTPSFRYHPAVVAQASATLAAMYPGRHWLGVGSGRALNERVIAGYWPERAERIDRMFEAIDLITKLFAGSLAGHDVRYSGNYFQMEATRLWTMPSEAPPIYVATSDPSTARRAGRVADGLITLGAPSDNIAHLFHRFAMGAREVGRDPNAMPRLLRVPLSWAPTDEEALEQALREWPNGGMPFPKADIRSPHDFAAMARLVREEHFAERMVISADPDEHRAALQRFIDLGFDHIYLHNVGRNQREWVEVFGREVLPGLVR